MSTHPITPGTHAPHPTLAQLVEEAAVELTKHLCNVQAPFGEPQWSRAVTHVAAIILRHLSPGWERMGRELSESRAECEEQARLNGMGAEREATLRTENEKLTKELSEAKEQWRMSSVCRELRAEVEQLRTRLSELEEDKAGQKP